MAKKKGIIIQRLEEDGNEELPVYGIRYVITELDGNKKGFMSYFGDVNGFLERLDTLKKDRAVEIVSYGKLGTLA